MKLSNEDMVFSELWKKGIRKKNLKMNSFGDSMIPFFKDNDKLKLQSAAEIQLGDVVCYLDKSDRIIYHRIVKINKESVITKGDNNLHMDLPILKSQILGKITTVNDNSLVFTKITNRIIAVHSFTQAKIYLILTDNSLAKVYCRVMEKHLKTPYFSLIYKQFTKLFVYPFYLLSGKKISIKVDIKKDVYSAYNDQRVVSLYKKRLEKGLLEFDKRFIESNIKKKGNVLVLGCGVGKEAIFISKLGNKVTGIDFAENMLTSAKYNAKKENLEINFFKADITNLPFEAESFDYATLLYTLVCLRKKDRLRFLAECRRILKKNGLLLVSTLQPKIYLSKEKKFLFILANFKRKILKTIQGEKYSGLEENDYFDEISRESIDHGKPILTSWFSVEDIIKEIQQSGFKLLSWKQDKNSIAHFIIKNTGV